MAEEEVTATTAWAPPEVLTTAEVAALLRVDPATVKRWVMPPPGAYPDQWVTARRARDRLGAFRTPGGHWRFDAEKVRRMSRAPEEET